MLWSEDWHEGVIGIVASRLVERFHRPVVMIAGSGDGWKGSGRSIPSFDLHGALATCAEHLERYGGHRAAAGLSISTEQLLQGPFADTMTHVGQLAMLRRLADSPVAPEDFIYADIRADRLHADQPPPARPDKQWPEAPEA